MNQSSMPKSLIQIFNPRNQC